MRILATSDLHGYLPPIKEEFDLLLICGDICPAHDHYYAFQIEWLKTEFVEWINSLPFKNPYSKVVMTWGNHDFVGERISKAEVLDIERMTNYRLKILRHDIYDFEYLNDEGVQSLKIFGTPYCSIFGNWAFMVSDETLEKKFSQIPEGIDIFISHDSPNINKLGAILEGKYKNDDTGNKILPKHIERIKPKIFLSGHFHSGNHEFKEYNGIWMANVSYVNEHYEPTNTVLSFGIDENNREIHFE